MAIKSFREERKLGSSEKGIQQVPLTMVTFDSHRSVCRRLYFLDNAVTIEDIANFKTNRLVKLGTRNDNRYHIWADARYAIEFRWEGSDATDVEVIDHGERGFE